MSTAHLVHLPVITIAMIAATYRVGETVRLLRRSSGTALRAAQLRAGSAAMIMGLVLVVVRTTAVDAGYTPQAWADLTIHVVALGAIGVGAAMILPYRRLVEEMVDQLDDSERVLEGLVEGAGGVFEAGSALEDAGLTKRERQIVELIARGVVTDREISTLLHISPATSATHVRNILRKTGFTNRQHLLLASLREQVPVGS